MNNYETLINNLQSSATFHGDILHHEPLAKKSTFKIGGTAELFIAPNDYYSFQLLICEAKKLNIKFFIVGGGSNIVFPDDEYKGLIISTRNFNDVEFFSKQDLPEDFGEVELDKNQFLVSCFAGTPMASFVNFCTQSCFSGAEQFAGLPGTIGGAVFMNARCFDRSISDILFYVSYLDYSGEEVLLKYERFNPSQWDYKKSPYQNNKRCILTATFLLTKKGHAEKNQISEDCKHYIAERLSKGHFIYPSAGSVFKNNRSFGKPSGQIIDEAGLRGTQIGGAKIAEFHGNFIVNYDHATQKDVKNLVEFTQKTVEDKYGFKLEPEIIFLEN